MDGENKGKPYEQMDDLGGKPPIFGSTPKCFLFGSGGHVTKIHDGEDTNERWLVTVKGNRIDVKEQVLG